MKILVSGSTGLVGRPLVRNLVKDGHDVRLLVRRDSAGPGEVAWNPTTGSVRGEDLEGLDAVIHLAGEGIANKRWNEEQKKKTRDSRVIGTRHLSEALASLENPPSTLICASAIGFYGSRDIEPLTELSSPGNDFLAQTCQDWEIAADPAREKGIRVVHLRFGVLLSPEGGALAKMLLPFKMGVGGILGNGEQYMSWLALDDAVRVIRFCVDQKEIHGAVNSVSPQSVTNLEFTKTLGKVLGRPTIFPMPAFAARLAFGEMADALLLSSAKVLPSKLEGTFFEFAYPDLEGALKHLLNR
ncbi:MAG: TIGR01777 family oxidoreductase [Candidatus Lindowbacteria bacterium]|nr:TIGR01777 family oxidoreductase [Candidatus Lindowbacteria bacterium]